MTDLACGGCGQTLDTGALWLGTDGYECATALAGEDCGGEADG